VNRDLGTSNDERKNRLKFFRLVKRFNQLYTLLPKLDDIDDDDIDKVAETR
jgi:hypothetical protein